jgi:hypothetical protein
LAKAGGRLARRCVLVYRRRAKRQERRTVTDRLALILGLILAALIGLDMALTGGETLVFLARKFLNLLDWVEFWR